MRDATTLNSAGEYPAAEVENPHWRIFNPGFAGLSFNGKPDIMGNLSCELMESKGGNEAYDAVRNPFSDLSEVDFGRHFHLSELIQPSRHGDQDPLIPKAINRSSMDSEVQGFTGSHETALVFKKFYGFFSGRFHGG